MIIGLFGFFVIQLALTVVVIIPVSRRFLPDWSIIRTSSFAALPFPALLMIAPFLYEASVSAAAATAVFVMSLMTFVANTLIAVAILRAWYF